MPWWIVTVSPACERRAVAGLADLGLSAWTPLRLVKFKTRYMAKPSQREYPTFPGYAFVDVGDYPGAEEWHRVCAADDVRAIVCAAGTGRPLDLGDKQMGRIRAQLDDLRHKPVTPDVWYRDDRARISDEAALSWRGFEGVVERGERRGSVRLLLALFGRQTAVEVPVEMLERAA